MSSTLNRTHGISVAVNPRMSVSAVLEKSGLDWKVGKVPTFTQVGSRRITLPKAALVRESDGKLLDVVSKNWEPLQNDTAFAFFRDLAKAAEMEIKAAGSLREGRYVFAMAHTKEAFTVHSRDTVALHVLMTNPHQFGKTLDVRFLAHRAVSDTSMLLGEVPLRVAHRKQFDAPEAVAGEMMTLGRAAMAEYKKQAALLSSVLYNDDLESYFKAVWPVITAKDQSRKDISKSADKAMELVNVFEGHEYGAGTLWQAFQCVIYMADHVLGKDQDVRVSSAWYGQNAKLKRHALDVAVRMAKRA